MSRQNDVARPQDKGRPIKVGDRVRFRFGNQTMIGIVTEDRGTIGVGGRRLLRIQVTIGEEERALELPVEEVRAA